MNRETFLNELAAGLALLAPSDRKQVLDYYGEMILDKIESGLSEEEAVAGLEPPEQIAARIRVEYGGRQPDAEGAVEIPAGELCEFGPRGEVHTVEIALKDVGVEVRPSADGQLRVWIDAQMADQITEEKKDGEYYLTHHPRLFDTNGWRMLILNIRREAVVELPAGFAGNLTVATRNARIQGEQLLSAGKARFISSNGKVELSDSGFETLIVKTANGRVSLNGLSGQSCKASTTNGRVSAGRCRFETKLRLGTTNGAIQVSGIEAPDISLTTTNGAIKGWVRGSETDYAVTSSTSNARSELRDTSACEERPGRLRARTTNAKIKLCFAQSAPDEEED